MPLNITALVFDFDGLILDTETPIHQAWLEVYRSYGFELPFEKWATSIGVYEEPFVALDYLLELAGGTLEIESVKSAQASREASLIAAQAARPGVEAYLQAAKRIGLKIGLASSSPCRWLAEHLDRLGLRDYFDCIRGMEDVRVTKPDPELYFSAAACLGVPPCEVIALEDSPNGVTAAKRAGMYCVVVPNPVTRLLPLDHADLVLNSLEDLPLEALIALAEREAD
jgi:HAD superfamily hydrolase (TIGR01509 family)